jgi:hypothetical protein
MKIRDRYGVTLDWIYAGDPHALPSGLDVHILRTKLCCTGGFSPSASCQLLAECSSGFSSPIDALFNKDDHGSPCYA